MSQARDHGIAVLYMLCHLLISQVEHTRLYDCRVWVIPNLRGEFARRADNSANIVTLAQQLLGASLNGAHLSEASLSGAHLAEADFSGAQLDGASLYGAHLGKANLTGANLERIRLVEADLKWADFSGASFRFARLDGSNFESANLANADLTAVAGFTAGQLAGADVTGTKLPGGMKDFESLSVTDEAAKNSRSLFLIVLLACVYSWLTLSTTTDAEVIMNTGSSPLPIIRVPVPILGFFLAAPTFLLAAYVYFHLYLHGLWSRLAELPAVFPDGRPLDQRAYPWLLTSLVRPHFERLKDERVLFSREKVWLSILLAWWVVPVTIYLFWAQALAAHVWYMNGSSPCPLRRFNGCRRRHVPGRSGDPGSQRPEAADGTSYARNDCCWGW